MPAGTWNLEWLDHNSQRNYPLTEDATCLSVDGDFTLPDDFIVGLYLAVPATQNISPSGFFIRYVGVYSTGYSVTIAYQPDNDNDAITVASAQIAKSGHVYGKAYALAGLGSFESSVGKIVIGKLDNIDKQPTGFHEFDLEGGRLETDSIRPQLRSVTGLILEDNGTESNLIYGTVKLQAGSRFRLRKISEDASEVVIELSAIGNDGLNEDCDCDGAETATPIVSINGVRADNSGNLTLLGNTCLQVTPGSNGIQLKDICSQPCCGCEELEKLTQSLELFGSKATTIENFLTGLEATVRQMDMVVLGSKLNDRGCT